MANPLENVPGYGAYIARSEQNKQQSAQNLQQAAQVMGFAEAIKQREQQDAYRRDLQALGPNAPMNAVLDVAKKHANPEQFLKLYQHEQERADAAQTKARQFADNLAFKQQQLDLQRDMFNQRTQDAAERAKFDQWYRGESLRIRQAQDQLNGQLRALGIQLQQQGQQSQQRDRLERAVTGFSNELQQNKIPALSAAITNANSLLSQYEDKPIPGIGAIEGSDMVPNLLRSEESKKVRGALQAVSNDLLNLYSGLAVTLPEAERRQLEEMRRGDFQEADFRNAWPNIVNRYNSVVGNLRAGASPEVLSEYQKRSGAIKLDPLVPAFSAKALPRVASDADFDKLPSGSEFIDPDGKRRRKP